MMTTTGSLLLLSMPGGGEMMMAVLLALILFGGKKIPELAKGLGKGIREFNEAKEGIKSELQNQAEASKE